MAMTCSDARALVDAYLDGELSEARASLLRKHLLDCHACRNGAQSGRHLKRWFAAAREEDELLAAAPGAVPSGFAARVARRAFAGDAGALEREPLAPQFTPQLTPQLTSGAALVGARRESPLLSFVLTATALAAGLALLLALGARLRGREVGSTMSADDRTAMPVKQVVEELERLNSGESAGGSVGDARR